MYELKKIIELKENIIKNNNPEDMIKLGEIYDKLHNEFLTEKFFRMANENGSLEGLFKLGNYYLKKGKLNLAESCFKEMADKGNDEFQNSLARVYKEQLKFDLAEEYYKLAIEQGNEKAVFNLGYMNFSIKKYDMAIKIWEQISDDPLIHIMLSKSYHYKKDLENCEKHLKLAGNNTEAYYLLGKLYIEKEMFDLAEKYLKICAKEKDDIRAQKDLYSLYINQRKYTLADKYLKMIVNNGDLKAILVLAEKYMNENKYKEAIEIYKNIKNNNLISFSENYFDEYELNDKLCKCYLKLEDFEKAEKYLEYIDEFEAFNYFIEIADIFYKKEMKEQAEKYYLSAFKIIKYREGEEFEEKKANISFKLGNIYIAEDKFVLAEKYLKKVVKNEYAIEAVYLLGTVYDKQNNLGLAKKYYSEANTEKAKNKLKIIEQKEDLINNI